MVPIVVFCGQSKSGKDTVAKYLTDTFGGVTIANADPLKAAMQKIFGLPDYIWWGSSEDRNISYTLVKEKSKYEFDKNEYFLTFDEAFIELKEECPFSKEYSFPPFLHSLFCKIPGGDEGKFYKLYREWFRSIIKSETFVPRKVLQTFGTEVIRELDPDFWIDISTDTAIKLLSGGYLYDKHTGLIPHPQAKANLVCITDGRFRNEIAKTKVLGGTAVKVERLVSDSTTPTAGVKNHSSETEIEGVPGHFFDVILQNDKDLATLYNKTWTLGTQILHLDKPQHIL